MSVYDAYVICTSPRSGSTLLCNILSKTGVSGNPGSWFHDPSVSEWLGYYNLTPDRSMPEREVLAEIFRAAIAKGRLATGIFGLRLQRHSFAYFRRKLAVLHPEYPGDAGRFQAAFGRTQFVHLTRRDKVEQAVSYVKAQQSGLWHAAPDGTELERLSPPRTPVYNAAEIRTRFEEMMAYDRGWEQWFMAEQINPLRITYETLSKDPLGTVRWLLDCLGLEGSAADGATPGIARLADDVNRDWVARFRADLGSS